MSCQFSIIIPTNQIDDLLVRALRSILVQREKEVDVILGWNGDSAPEESPYWSQVTSLLPSIRVFMSAAGAGPARNKAMDEALGEYLVFLDSDDELQPGALHVLSASIEKFPNVDVIHFSAFDAVPGRRLHEPSWYVSRDRLARAALKLGEVVRNEKPWREHFYLVSPAPWLRCIRTNLVDSASLKFQSLTNVNDLFFFISLMSSSHTSIFLDRRLVVYSRGHARSSSAKKSEAAKNVSHALSAANNLVRRDQSRRRFIAELGYFSVGQLLSYWSYLPKGMKLEMWPLAGIQGFLLTVVRNPRQAVAFVLMSLGIPINLDKRLKRI